MLKAENLERLQNAVAIFGGMTSVSGYNFFENAVDYQL